MKAIVKRISLYSIGLILFAVGFYVHTMANAIRQIDWDESIRNSLNQTRVTELKNLKLFSNAFLFSLVLICIVISILYFLSKYAFRKKSITMTLLITGIIISILCSIITAAIFFESFSIVRCATAFFPSLLMMNFIYVDAWLLREKD